MVNYFISPSENGIIYKSWSNPVEETDCCGLDWSKVDLIRALVEKRGPFYAMMKGDLSGAESTRGEILASRRVSVWAEGEYKGVAVIGVQGSSVYFIPCGGSDVCRYADRKQIYSVSYGDFAEHFISYHTYLLDSTAHFDQVDRSMSNMEDSTTLLLGKTSSGKTSYALYVNGGELEVSVNLRNGCYQFKGEGIGNRGTSETKTMRLYGKYVDLPGLFDTGGAEAEVKNAYILRRCSGSRLKFRVVLLLTLNDIDSGNDHLESLRKILCTAGRILLTHEHPGKVAQYLHILVTKVGSTNQLYGTHYIDDFGKKGEKIPQAQRVKNLDDVWDDALKPSENGFVGYDSSILARMISVIRSISQERFYFFYQPEKKEEDVNQRKQYQLDGNDYDTLRLGADVSADAKQKLKKAHEWLRAQVDSSIQDFTVHLSAFIQKRLETTHTSAAASRQFVREKRQALVDALFSLDQIVENMKNHVIGSQIPRSTYSELLDNATNRINDIISALTELTCSTEPLGSLSRFKKSLQSFVRNIKLIEFDRDFDFNLEFSSLRKLNDELGYYENKPKLEFLNNDLHSLTSGILGTSDIHNYINMSGSFSNIRLVAPHVIIDQSIKLTKKNSLDGISLEFNCSHLYWHEKVIINLSGESAQNYPSSANSGEEGHKDYLKLDCQIGRESEDLQVLMLKLTRPPNYLKKAQSGDNGLKGSSGGNSGNLNLKGFRNSGLSFHGIPENLEVKMNGGDGGKGQNGGDGADGLEGHWATILHAQNRYDAGDGGKGTAPGIFWKIVHALAVPAEINYYEYDIPRGEGQQGGDAGLGGEGGEAGRPGQLRVDGVEQAAYAKFRLMRTEGDKGLPGNDGKSGTGGIHGISMKVIRMDKQIMTRNNIGALMLEGLTVSATSAAAGAGAGTLVFPVVGTVAAGAAGAAAGFVVTAAPNAVGAVLTWYFYDQWAGTPTFTTDRAKDGEPAKKISSETASGEKS